MAVKELLITDTDVRAVGKIAESVDILEIEKSIKVAQNQDIKASIGAALLIDLLNDALSTDLTNLYNGSTYVVDGVTYSHSGIKEACKYYAYSRLLRSNQISVTPYGVVKKAATESEIVTEKELMWQVNNNNEIATTYILETLHFLASFPLIFPSYLNKNKRTVAGVRVSSIGD